MIFVSLTLTSLSMIISRSIYVIADDILSFFFVTEQYSIVYILLHCLYPFICKWTFKLFPCLAYCRDAYIFSN